MAAAMRLCAALGVLLCVALGGVTADSSAAAEYYPVTPTEVVLETLFYTTGGGHSWRENNWLSTNAVCSWTGVTCSNEGVTTINLDGMGLRGLLPASLLNNITTLSSLSLCNNELSGVVPLCEPRSALLELYLMNNNFTDLSGAMSCPTINSFYGDGNPLTTYPVAAAGAPSSVSLLSLADCNLTSAAPVAFAAQFYQLGYLDLSWNWMNCTVDWMADLLTVDTLFVQYNLLRGPIEPLSAVPYLSLLNVTRNQLSGTLPATPFPSLKLLSANENLFTGVVPAWLGCGAIVCQMSYVPGLACNSACGWQNSCTLSSCDSCHRKLSCNSSADCNLAGGDCLLCDLTSGVCKVPPTPPPPPPSPTSPIASPPPPVGYASPRAKRFDITFPLIGCGLLALGVCAGVYLCFRNRMSRRSKKGYDDERSSLLRPGVASTGMGTAASNGSINDPAYQPSALAKQSQLEQFASPHHERTMHSLRDRAFIPFEELVFGAEIGRGAYGSVYAGQLRGQACAIKDMRLSAAMAETALREISIMRKLSHPNIVQFWGYAEAGQSIYIVMELVDGGSLRDLLAVSAARAQLTPSKSVWIATLIADGLAYMHSSGILHRDLKSANVLVAMDGMTVTAVKLADFGVSRIRDDTAAAAGIVGSVDQTMTVRGTPVYMSPELLRAFYHGDRDARYSVASDVFSLGMVLYELLTQSEEFRLKRYAASATVQGQRPGFAPAWRAANPRLVALIEACWQDDASRRPVAEVVVAELRAVAAELPPV